MTALLSKPAALRAAASVLTRTPGDSVVLAHRPGRHIAHAYVGPLTRSGRFLPRSGRPLCGTRCRQLRVAATAGEGLRLCRTCSTCLSRALPPGEGRQAEHPTRRDDWVDEFAGLTLFDLAIDLFMAETHAEVNRVVTIALQQHDLQVVQTEPVVSPAGKVSPPLAVLIRRARARTGEPSALQHIHDANDVNRAEAAHRRRKQVHEAWSETEQRKQRLGINLATARH